MSQTQPRIVGKTDLIKDLSALGLAPGDGVFVHTSLGQIGHVIGGPRGLIEALIETVGETGLVAMPGFSTDAYDPADLPDLDLTPEERARIRREVPGFDPLRSNVRGNGSVPEAFRQWPGTQRSPHPTSSVLLHGYGAAALAAEHDPHGWATGPDSPWGRLRQRPFMKILLIGVGWSRCSAFHAAESLASHRRTKMRHFKLGTGPDARWIDAPDVADDLGRLFPSVGEAWEATGGVRTGLLGQASCKLTGYGALLDFATTWIDQRNRGDGVPRAQ